MGRDAVIAGLAASLSLLAGIAGWGAARSVARRRVLTSLVEAPHRTRQPHVRLNASIRRMKRVVLWISCAGVAALVVGPPGGVVAAVALIVIPRMVRRRRARRLADAIESQLAAAVSGISAGLRAGLSLSQSIRFAAAECEPPLATSLDGVIAKEDLGVPLDEALRAWADLAASDDVRLLVSALGLRIGAGLPAVLDQVSGALRSRQAGRREVRSLTAQARLSGTILGILPIGFFLFLSATSRHDMAAAYGTAAGLAAILTGLVLQAGAYLWIRRLVAVGPT